ncbi:hypothetical protein EDD37DRAFT_605089 [Exophiala viscosa]|uniref:uncharacterized protein n=1 Tax=Exophiala viscosa TaxID=2486360 RepID=UPI00219EA2E5|nr:hypothetical protein EDD37DRAFT_605089 [Exophiala viscosa]
MAFVSGPLFPIYGYKNVKNVMLAQPRQSDGPMVVAALNDPRVYMNLNGPPYPYTEKDWEEWYLFVSHAARECSKEYQVIDEELGDQGRDPKERECQRKRLIMQSMWPLTIRIEPELLRDRLRSESAFIGTITPQRSIFLYILDEDERQRRKQENDGLAAGDPKIIWEVGFYLIPDYHGRGIMPAVLRTVIKDVLIQYMNAHIVEATYFEHNSSSKRVLEKCGFRFVQLVPDAIALPPTKTNGVTGRKVGLGVMRWQGA